MTICMNAHIVNRRGLSEFRSVSRFSLISAAMHSPARRHILAGILLAALAGLDGFLARKPAMAGEPQPHALLGGPAEYAGEQRIAMERGQPLLLFFSLTGCAFCEALRADQLRHVHAQRERLGIRVIELRMDDDRPIPGLEPARSPKQIAGVLRVRVSPTVVFLDGEREVAERLVGYTSRDFYGAYLDAGIASARAATGERRPPG